MPAQQPPTNVLHAFGAQEPPRPLTGGQGTSWVSGGLVFKPGGDTVHEWLGETLAHITPIGFRLAVPVRSRHGTWSWDGWTATTWVEGAAPDHTTESTWVSTVDAGRAFHRGTAHLPRPDCLDARNDHWAVADRVAWGEHHIRFRPELADLSRRLQQALEPLGPAQLVHGDLTGNVLSSPHLPPAVIDVSPYWRPPAYAEGVVVADALCWHGAEASLLDKAKVRVAAVARALLFRVATTSLARPSRIDVHDEALRYARAAELIGI